MSGGGGFFYVHMNFYCTSVKVAEARGLRVNNNLKSRSDTTSYLGLYDLCIQPGLSNVTSARNGQHFISLPSPRKNRMFLATLVLSFRSNTDCKVFWACDLQYCGFSSSTKGEHTGGKIIFTALSKLVVFICFSSISQSLIRGAEEVLSVYCRDLHKKK